MKMSKAPPEPLYTFRGTMAPVLCTLVNINQDNELLYAGTIEGYVHIWDLKTKRERNRLKVGEEPCACILYNGGLYLTLLKGDSIKFWTEENNSWKLKRILKIDYGGFCPMVVLGDLVFLPDNEKNIVIFDIIKNKETSITPDKSLGHVICLKVIEPTENILAVYENGEMYLYDKALCMLSHSKFVSVCPMAVDYCEETKEGILGTVSNEFHKFAIGENNKFEKVSTGSLTNPGVQCISIKKDGTLCVLGCWDGRIRYYSMKKMKLLAVLIHHSETIHTVHFVNTELSFCENGMVVAASKDKRISLWNLYTSSRTRT